MSDISYNEDTGHVTIDGRCFDPELNCWIRQVPPSPVPPPREPRIEGGGTPKELAARALDNDEFLLAGCYLEQAEVSL